MTSECAIWDLRTDEKFFDSKKINHSSLSHIVVKSSNPMDLLREWYHDVKKYADPNCTMPNLMNLATCNSDGEVHARNLYMRQIVNDNIHIMTDRRGTKCKDLIENTNVACTFFWCFTKNNIKYARQVRIQGIAKELNTEETQKMYSNEPLYCKIRSHLCHQGLPVEWTEAKAKHDKMYEEVLAGKNSLPMPDNVVGFEIVPHKFDYYQADGEIIGDRVVFEMKWGKWENYHVYS